MIWNEGFPILRVQHCLDAMVAVGLFFTIDITSSYNQVPVAEHVIPTVAFVAKCGFYAFTTNHLGLIVFPETH